MGIVQDRLQHVIMCKASERNTVKIEIHRQLTASEADVVNLLLTEQEFEQVREMLLEEQGEKLAVIDAKYAMTLEVLDLILDDAQLQGVAL